ncbi:hypothetical protein OROHE_018301 [Orobanche hederae]
MAPEALSRSRQPSSEKPENEEPSAEEEESEDELSDSHSSKEEKEVFSGETGYVEGADPKVVKYKIDQKLVDKGVGSDSESDLDSPSNYKVQPISKTKPPNKPSPKRTYQESDGKSQHPVRNIKKSKTDEGKSFFSSPSNPAGCITRLWSDEDEVTVLNGMIDFKNTEGQDPNADMWAFYNFIKGKLKVDFSKDQLKTKIRRMKKRFANALKKSENGEDPVFSKPHEDRAFELSKKIWGGYVVCKAESINIAKVELDQEKKIVDKDGEEEEEGEDEEEDEGDFGSKYPFLRCSFSNLKSSIPCLDMSESGIKFAMKRLSLIGNDKAKELEDKWKQLISEEVELIHKKMTLMKQQMKMAFNM